MQFRLVSEKWTGITGMASIAVKIPFLDMRACCMPCLGVLAASKDSYLINFTQMLDSDTQLVFVHSVKLQYCNYIHVPVPNCISVAGCLCPFSGSSS